MLRIQRFQELTRFAGIDLQISRFDREQEAILAGPDEEGRVEQRMVRLRQADEEDHSDDRGDGGSQDCQLERHRYKRRCIVQRLAAAGWSVSFAADGMCPIVDLAGQTFDSFLDTLGASHRANIRRRLRALERRFDVRFQPVVQHADRRVMLDALAVPLRRFELPIAEPCAVADDPSSAVASAFPLPELPLPSTDPDAAASELLVATAIPLATDALPLPCA